MYSSITQFAWIAAALFLSIASDPQPESDAALLMARKLDQRIEQVKDLPDKARAGAIHELALQIKQQPLRFELPLASNLAIDGEENADQVTLQEIADVLSDALRKLGSDAKDRGCYQDLAELIHSAHVQTTWHDQRLSAAVEQLGVRDRALSKYDFSLQDLKGDTWNLKRLRGKVVLVNFWETWCPPCRREMPELDEVYRKFEPQGLVVLGITYEETGLVRRFIAERPVAYPILLDPAKTTEKPFFVRGFPGNVVFDRDGNQAASWNDRPTHEKLIEMLKAAGLRE